MSTSALYWKYTDRVNEIRAQMGLSVGTYDPKFQRFMAPPGNARVAHLASLLALCDVVGPDAPATCPTCYLAWVDSKEYGAESPERCCTAWEATCFESHEHAARWR